ncbi:hypothetical protein [Streptomyces sp. NPDC059631]|uniref:hypothetical protein n=1 Tax=unclassified Streptomyces TaxID=2593676 RepID=UPI0036C80410
MTTTSGIGLSKSFLIAESDIGAAMYIVAASRAIGAAPEGSTMYTSAKWPRAVAVNSAQSIIIACVDSSTVFKVGDSYVALRTPQAACSSDASILDLASTQRTAFTESFKSVQLDQ